MALHTLFPTALPLFKALLVGLFKDGLQSGRRVRHYFFSRFKPLAFQRRLEGAQFDAGACVGALVGTGL